MTPRSSVRARGGEHEFSDIDIALVACPQGRARRHEVYDVAFDVGLEYRVNLTPVALERERFEFLKARERPIAHDTEREGVPL